MPRARAIGLALALAACGNSSKTSPGHVILDDGSAPPSACTLPAGASGSPGGIDGLATLVNALGAERSFPIDIPCVLESLDRPLGILASQSPFSLQQTTEPRSPRFFLFTGGLVITAAPVGDGRHLLELGDEVSETRSVKAEIAFPVKGPLPAAQPYEHLVENGATACGSCHGLEKPAPRAATPNVFESEVFRPLPTQEVDLAFLRNESMTCDAQVEPERCALFTAIFGHGELVPRHFSPNAKTIYDN